MEVAHVICASPQSAVVPQRNGRPDGESERPEVRKVTQMYSRDLPPSRGALDFCEPVRATQRFPRVLAQKRLIKFQELHHNMWEGLRVVWCRREQINHAHRTMSKIL
jgi:hypothetical protein